jgi:hypothetical protein
MYVLSLDQGYEGEACLGVYTTQEKAEAAWEAYKQHVTYSKGDGYLIYKVAVDDKPRIQSMVEEGSWRD